MDRDRDRRRRSSPRRGDDRDRRDDRYRRRSPSSPRRGRDERGERERERGARRRRSPTPPPRHGHQRLPPPPPRPPPPPLAPSPPLDPRLDFFSPSFDAAAALASPGLLPPIPRVATRDTVEQCRALLPPDCPESMAARRAARRAAAQAAAAEGSGGGAAGGEGEELGGREGLQPAPDLARLRRPDRRDAGQAGRASAPRFPGGMVAAISASAGGADPMAGGADAGAGPLSLLLRLSRGSPGARVRVTTRHARGGVRGVATGTLHAFDRHCNLVLGDVQESYSVRLWASRAKPASVKGGGDAPPGTKVRPHLEPRSRRLRLVFIRGDAVVMVGEARE